MKTFLAHNACARLVVLSFFTAQTAHFLIMRDESLEFQLALFREVVDIVGLFHSSFYNDEGLDKQRHTT